SGWEAWATPDPERSDLGKSLWLAGTHVRDEGRAPPVDLALEKAAGEIVRERIAYGRVNALNNVSDGGLAIALAELTMASWLSAEFVGNDQYTEAQWWFGEDQGRYVITVPGPEALNRALAKGTRDEDTARVGFRRLGTVRGDTLFGVPLTDL